MLGRPLPYLPLTLPPPHTFSIPRSLVCPQADRLEQTPELKDKFAGSELAKVESAPAGPQGQLQPSQPARGAQPCSLSTSATPFHPLLPMPRPHS